MHRTALLAVIAVVPTVNLQTEPVVCPDYRCVFSYIASREDIAEEDPDLFKLAAESTAAHVEGNAGEWFLVVEPNYFNAQHLGTLRGAQGNGPIYVFREVAPGFQFLGIMFGNSYRIELLGGHPRFRTRSHISAAVSQEARYEIAGDSLVKQ